MKLGALIAGGDYLVNGGLDTDVTGICYDSRRVAGEIFFSLWPGTRSRTKTI